MVFNIALWQYYYVLNTGMVYVYAKKWGADTAPHFLF